MLSCLGLNEPVWPDQCKHQLKHNTSWSLKVLPLSLHPTLKITYFRFTRCGSPTIFSSSLYFNYWCINVTASCWASQALVSSIGSQRGGGVACHNCPGLPPTLSTPPRSESGLTGLRGHLHWIGWNVENVGSDSILVCSRVTFKELDVWCI